MRYPFFGSPTPYPPGRLQFDPGYSLAAVAPSGASFEGDSYLAVNVFGMTGSCLFGGHLFVTRS